MKLRYKISLVVVAFLIIASLFLVQSYALWLTTYEGQENILSVGCFDVALEELSKPISLNNTYPMSDQKGLTQTPYKFTIKNSSEISTANASYDCKLFLDLNFDGNLSSKEEQTEYIQIQDAAGNVRGIHIFGEVTLSFPSIIEIILILAAAFLSFKTTDKKIRVRNHFTWGAIKEVAVLFIGIFITMQPALMLLKAVGPNLGITEPYQMFWATGALSSFLDNTPTYLVFLTTAGTLGFTSGIATTLGTVPVKLLSAISCGAVFMGANTYIGNAPNFMVKTLSDENGINMPSFFGYMGWSICFLVPVFIIDMLVFFL